jgi:hypothetical protein
MRHALHDMPRLTVELRLLNPRPPQRSKMSRLQDIPLNHPLYPPICCDHIDGLRIRIDAASTHGMHAEAISDGKREIHYELR